MWEIYTVQAVNKILPISRIMFNYRFSMAEYSRICLITDLAVAETFIHIKYMAYVGQG